jgi:hypothetical protein
MGPGTRPEPLSEPARRARGAACAVALALAALSLAGCAKLESAPTRETARAAPAPPAPTPVPEARVLEAEAEARATSGDLFGAIDLLMASVSRRQLGQCRVEHRCVRPQSTFLLECPHILCASRAARLS